MGDPLDGAIAAVARRQEGNIHRRQLRALGLDNNAIGYRVRIGRLFREFRNVYAVGRPATSPVERASAAVLACSPGAALSDFSALAHWSFVRRYPYTPEVTVALDRRISGIKIHLRTQLLKRDVRTHHGIKVTSPARALLDTATRAEKLTRLVNDALHTWWLTPAQLKELLDRFPHHPGTRLIVPILDDTRRGLTRSDFEDRFRAFCRRYGLPEPIFNVIVNGRLVDAYFPEAALIVECDSWEFHRLRSEFENDRNRIAEHLAADVATYPLTWQRLEHDPNKEADRLRRIIDRRRRSAAA